MQNLYDILGVPSSATAQQIKQAYRDLARRHHPDRNRDDPEQAAKQFQVIQEAYEVLSNPLKRRQYDRQQRGSTIGFAPFHHGRQVFNGDDVLEHAGHLMEKARKWIGNLLDKH